MKYYKTTIYLPDDTQETWVNFTDDEIVKFAEFEKEAREWFIKYYEETPEEKPEDWKDYLCDFYQEKGYVIQLEINGYVREVVVYGVDLDNPIEDNLENDVMDIDPTMNLGLKSPMEMID